MQSSNENFIPTSIMITGGCGFIGSNFVNHAAKVYPQAKLINFDKLMIGSNACNVEESVRQSTNRYHLVVGDLRNRQLLLDTFEQHQIDTIFNFAANSHVDDCYSHPVATTENNVIGMIQLLEAVRNYGRIRRFVHISSDEVYGDSHLDQDEIPKSESTPMMPTNPYSASKAACESMLNA